MSSEPARASALLPTYANILLPLTLVRGEGAYVFDEGGRRYLDLYSGHAVTSIGHSHPRWVGEVQAQVATLSFYSNAVGSPVRDEAAQILADHSYPSISGVFFVNSGAEANETALKMARKATGRPIVVSMERGFHGRTMGALSATGFPALRDRFPQNAGQWTRFVPMGDFSVFAELDPTTIAAVLLEPIQSVAGVYASSASYYRELRRFCSLHGICLIFDEVQTGTGRTGHWYAGTHWDVEPDIVTTAKGVAGGIAAGAVLVNDWIRGTVEPGDQATTFGGNPLAAAGIRATYRIIEEEGLLERVRTQASTVMCTIGGLDGIVDVRGYGYLLGVQCEVPARILQARLLDAGVIVGTCSEPHTIRLLPPLTLREEEWEEFLGAFQPALDEGPPA